ESRSADHTRSEPTNSGLGQLLPALRRPEGLQENGPPGLARTVEMGETPSSKEVSAVGSPTVLPHRGQSSRGLCRRKSPNPVVSRHPHYQDAEGQRESSTDAPRPEDILGTTGTMATEDSHHRQAKKEPTPSARLSLWSVQNALVLRRSYRRSPHQTQTARWGRSPGQPHACASGVSPCTPAATGIQSSRGLSRVRGDSHARFLGGCALSRRRRSLQRRGAW